MAEEVRNIERDYRYIDNWVKSHEDMAHLAQILKGWIPLLLNEKSELAKIAARKQEAESELRQAQEDAQTARKEADAAVANKNIRLGQIQKQYDDLDADLKSQIGPAQTALTSLQSQILSAEKELDATNQVLTDKQKEKDSLLKSMEKEKQTFEADMTALRQKHFGT